MQLYGSNDGSVPMAARQLHSAVVQATTPTNAPVKPVVGHARKRSSLTSKISYDMRFNKTRQWNCIQALRDPEMFHLLELHAKKSLNSEYTEFWAEMNAYKDKWYARRAERQAGMLDTSQKQVNVDVETSDRFADQPMGKREFCQYICDKYIRNNAPFQVNISDTMRQTFEFITGMSDGEVVAELAQQRSGEVECSAATGTVACQPITIQVQSNAVNEKRSPARDRSMSISYKPTTRPRLPQLNLPYVQPVDPQRLHGQQLFMVLLEIQREVYKLINTNLWVTFKKSDEFTSRQLQCIEDVGERRGSLLSH